MTHRIALSTLTWLISLLIAATVAAQPQTNSTMTANTASTPAIGPNDAVVEIVTSEGPIRVMLYGDTPRHRDNFVKLASEGYYDGTLFHRVIKDFMVQGGDPDSKGAPKGKMLGMGEPGYDIEAEFEAYPRRFHKKGALAAARQGDAVNPQKRSSGSQFYIVTGKTYNASQLDQMEQRMRQAQLKSVFDSLAAQHRDSIMSMRRNHDRDGLQVLQDTLVAKAEAMVKENPVKLTPEQREAYTTVGGTPHLDGAYTVFGEVIDGMEVVDKIQQAATDSHDRPLDDIVVEKMAVINPGK